MNTPAFWLFTRPSLGDMERIAAQAEAQGWDGISLTDSQNLSADTYVALTLAARATSRIGLGPGVTNPLTRHAAVTAGAIASLGELSGGRAMLGIGRGDSSLFNIGHEPAPPRRFERYVDEVQTYLAGGTLDANGYPSRLHWLDPGRARKVPLDLAATGPRVIAIGARHAERVTFAVGADPERARWAIDTLRKATPPDRKMPSPGLYVNVCADRDLERAAEMVRGGVGTFAHFTGMSEAAGARVRSTQDREVFRDLGTGYDRPGHGRADSAHARRLPREFIERFAIIGSPAHCRARVEALLETGIERLFVIVPRVDQFGDAAADAVARFAEEVIPPLR